MNGIESAFTGKLGNQPELKTSKSGKPWCSLNIMVGEGEAVQWVRVAAFGETAEAVANLAKGSSVYVEGKLSLNTWTTEGGQERSGLNVAANHVQPLGQIGRKRPTGSRSRGSSKSQEPGKYSAGIDSQRPLEYADRSGSFNDPIPF